MKKKKKKNPRDQPKKKKNDYNFDLWIIFLLLSIVKINIFKKKREIFLLVIDDFIVKTSF